MRHFTSLLDLHLTFRLALRKIYTLCMKKETSIAIFLGILAGVSIGALVMWQSKQAQQNSSDVLQGSITPTISVVSQEITPLLITSPENEAISTSSTIALKGSSQVGALLVIQSETSEQVEKTKKEDFEVEIELIPGENTIRLTSYLDKTIDSRTLVVYYIPEK